MSRYATDPVESALTKWYASRKGPDHESIKVEKPFFYH